MRSFNRGFTLFELLVSVLIVALLSAIAFSTYRSMVISAKMDEVEGQLEMFALNLERYYSENGNYVGAAPNAEYGDYTIVRRTCESNPHVFRLEATPNENTIVQDEGRLVFDSKGISWWESSERSERRINSDWCTAIH